MLLYDVKNPINNIRGPSKTMLKNATLCILNAQELCKTTIEIIKIMPGYTLISGLWVDLCL